MKMCDPAIVWLSLLSLAHSLLHTANAHETEEKTPSDFLQLKKGKPRSTKKKMLMILWGLGVIASENTQARVSENGKVQTHDWVLLQRRNALFLPFLDGSANEQREDV
mmetsp:Transcript_43493/g.87405  ORF Transcript_43493/g.87405 Transcript_43493/m.87405 type:complete len:108 (-) Transcript_43493:429-752(-)